MIAMEKSLMDPRLIQIFEAIRTVHDLEKEFSTFFGWFRFLDKRKYKKIKLQLIDCINRLYDEEWTITYLHRMEKSLEAFYLLLQDFLGKELYIVDFPNCDHKNNVFLPICFMDQRNLNRIIRLEIISDDISFKIIDYSTGNTFTISANHSVQEDQKQIEAVCKHCLVSMILRFLNNEKD